MAYQQTITVYCMQCGQSSQWDLSNGPAHKASCPFCDKKEHKRIIKNDNKKRIKRKMLTKEERYPANKGKPKPKYPQEWHLDFHCRSINEYHLSPHIRVKDKGYAYRALEALEIAPVRRVDKKVSVTIISYRKKLLDPQSLYGGSAKGLLDVIVRLGWVKDDTPEWCNLIMKQEQVLVRDIKAGKRLGTYVKLEIADDAE